jgi:hypothetical protein
LAITKDAQYLATVLHDLHDVFVPHSGQIGVGKAIFYDGKRRVFVRCGRKWGKSSIAIYILYRWAMTIPNGQFYYVAPFYNQASEIIWKSRRLQDFLLDYDKKIDHRSKYIAEVHETDKRVIFKNGSFIKLVGSDNFEAGRGFNPNGAVYDEAKDFDFRFHEGFEPNLLAKKAALVVFGTPPNTTDHPFVRMEEDFKQDIRGAYFKQPTWTNPHIDKEELELEKQSSILKNEWAKYMREIEAEIVPGGANAIFPMFTMPKLGLKGEFVGYSDHVKAASDLDSRVLKYPKDYNFYVSFDPGSALVFGVLFAAVHKFTKQVLILDEIYETDRNKTTAKLIYPRAVQIMKRYTSPERFQKIYDYAATWFQVEVNNEFGVALTPCTKDVNKKEVGLSVIKDFMLDSFEDGEKFFLVSDRCVKFVWELVNYSTDENGNIPKKNDHLVDNLRYISNSAGLSTVQRQRHKRSDDIREWTNLDYMEDTDIIAQPIDFFEDETGEWYE